MSGAQRPHRLYQGVGKEGAEEGSTDLFLKVPETQTQSGQMFREEVELREDLLLVMEDNILNMSISWKIKTNLVENLNMPELQVMKKPSIQYYTECQASVK